MSTFKSKMDFSGKTVVVAGGLGLIGQPVCKAFVEYGAKVVIADIDRKKFDAFAKAGKSSGDFDYLHFDISKYKQIESGFKTLLRKYRSIDVWVNLAYPRTADWGAALKDVTCLSWDKNIQMHLGGYFWSSKLILEHMKKQKKGCLINFGSIYGIVGPHFDIYSPGKTSPAAYAAIKGAVVNLSRYFAALYGPYGVRVNTICPGGIFDHQDKTFVKNYSRLAPLKRMAFAEELALPTVFLASEGAAYITGHTLMVDGGWTSW